MSEEIYDSRPDEHPYIDSPTILGDIGLDHNSRNVAVELRIVLYREDTGLTDNRQFYKTAVFPENTFVNNDVVASLLVATYPNTYPSVEYVFFVGSDNITTIFSRPPHPVSTPVSSARPT